MFYAYENKVNLNLKLTIQFKHSTLFCTQKKCIVSTWRESKTKKEAVKRNRKSLFQVVFLYQSSKKVMHHRFPLGGISIKPRKSITHYIPFFRQTTASVHYSETVCLLDSPAE